MREETELEGRNEFERHTKNGMNVLFEKFTDKTKE